MGSFASRNSLFAVWTTFVHRAAGYQAVILLSVIYVVAVGLSAAINALMRQHLLDVGTSRESYWTVRSSPSDLGALERPY